MPQALQHALHRRVLRLAAQHHAQPRESPAIGIGAEADGAGQPIRRLLAGEAGDASGDQLDPIQIGQALLQTKDQRQLGARLFIQRQAQAELEAFLRQIALQVSGYPILS